MNAAYIAAVTAGLVVSVLFWARLARRDERLVFIYLIGLGGAFLGAKLLYIAAEGWILWGQRDVWLAWATGKSIVGALIGGFLAVELGKRLIGYHEKTGDRFATILPVTILIGRIGCLIHGCCLGQICGKAAWWTLSDHDGRARWPAVPLEMAFQVAAIIFFHELRRRNVQTGQHFHLYMIGYGLFRFLNESARDTPRLLGPISGYQLAAFLLAGIGFVAWRRRAAEQPLSAIPPENAHLSK